MGLADTRIRKLEAAGFTVVEVPFRDYGKEQKDWLECHGLNQRTDLLTHFVGENGKVRVLVGFKPEQQTTATLFKLTFGGAQ